MKPADCICKIDKLGRVLIPKNLRSRFDFQVDDPIEVFTDGESIILKKYRKRCAFCGSEENVMSYKEKYICADCAAQVSKLK